MKVKRVLNALFDDRYGGPQKRVIDVGRGLLNHGVETVLLVPEGEGSAPELARKSGLEAVRIGINKMPRPSQILKVMWWLLLLPKDIYLISQIIKDNRINIVHVNGAFFVAPAIASKLCGKPLVWHLNDTVVPLKIAGFLGFLVKWLADEVVVAAAAVARHYCIAAGTYSIIYAPVDEEVIRKKKEYFNRAHKKKVGLIANWNPLKGIEVFVKSAAIVKAELKDGVEFVIAGSRLESHKDYASKIDALIDSTDIVESVECVGFVEDVNTFLQELDVLVLASWSEACPMVVLEAMAAGVPVVATNVGGVCELLFNDDKEATGCMVEPGDHEAMASEVVRLLSDKELCETMGASGRVAVEKQFSLSRCQQRHLAVYNRLGGRL